MIAGAQIAGTHGVDVQGVFRALADPTRRDILVFLSQRDMSIGEVADRFDITRAAVKKHLTILQQGELISVHPRGRERINRLEPLGLKTANDWLNHFNRFWDQRLRALQDAVENEENQTHD
jgi:DNA-binding transcriptional ArsR family regulator